MGDYTSTPTIPGIIRAIHSRLDNLERRRGVPKYQTSTLPNAADVEGLVVYDITTKTLKFSNGTSWLAV